jgi:hypothetical protein
MSQAGQLKTWMVVVAALGLLSGIAIGYALPRAYAAVFPNLGGYPELVELRQTYGLTAEQTRKLLLVWRDREARRIEVLSSAQLPPELENRLQAVYRQADDRIEAVLDSAQRAQYRRDRDQLLESSSPNRRVSRAKNR